MYKSSRSWPHQLQTTVPAPTKLSSHHQLNHLSDYSRLLFVSSYYLLTDGAKLLFITFFAYWLRFTAGRLKYQNNFDAAAVLFYAR